MFRFIYFFKDMFLNYELDLRIRMFNVLAMTGITVSIIATISCIINNEGIASTLANFSTAFIAYGLMYYASESGRYHLCYMITIISIFFVSFTFIFFLGGGYHGAMPFFFIFAIVFTVYMLEGRKAIVMSGLELVFYTSLCIFAYFYPQTVYTNDSAGYKLIEVLVGYLSVSIMLGSTMFLQFGMYNRQQKELESARIEALKLSEAKSNFLANMSHEIRTPINVILGMNEIILRESESPQIKKYSANIKRAGKTLMLLINNVLDVSKIEAGKISVAEEEYKTADFIAELSVIGAEQAGKYGLSFKTEADSCLPSVLIGDSVHLNQIIVNFLGNAAKYTKQGGITLIFSQRQAEAPDEILLRVSVVDTGIGIKKENMQLLFDAFTRADMPSSRYIEGTGLGLAIAKELAELMGGQVFVESEWGVGSTFSVEIQQKVAEAAPIDIECIQSNETGGSSVSRVGFIAPNASILVVDDNKENLQVIRSLLSRTIMHIDTAESGAKCVEKIEASISMESSGYDVILMDYMMPEMNGVETLRRLKKIRGFKTPVVALTANIISGTKERLLSEGFVKYISKPVVLEVLEAALLSILPHSLVSIGAVNMWESMQESDKAVLSEEFSKYGITLESGLQFLGGDIEQYGKLASFFLENYQYEKSEIFNLSKSEDYDALKFRVHSLKSKALAVGAEYLSATAAKLEGMCDYEDTMYIQAVLQILYFEWERVCDGLDILICKLGYPMSAATPQELSKESYYELRELLKYNRQPDALSLLETMICSVAVPEDSYRLREIMQLVDSFKFREAEKLLEELMGGVAYG